MKKNINENELEDFNSLSYKCNIEPFSLQEKEELAKDIPNVKFGKGLYKVSNKMYMSIWAYKNEYDEGYNSSSENYRDAIDISEDGLARDIVIVHTHSPYFPKVRGYLRSNLDRFYNN